MRFSTALVALLLLTTATALPRAAAQHTISTLSVSLGVDGYSTVNYGIAADPTTANITLPLIGSKITDLIITDPNRAPLNYQLGASSVLIYTLGSDAEVSYSTPSLTSKRGDLWSMNLTSPSSLTVLLPEGATIVSVSQVPLQISTIGGRPSVVLPDGPNEVTYELGIVGTKDHALLVITDAEAAINQAKANNLITTYPDTLLAKSKAYYNVGNYVSAEDYANQAKQAITTLTAIAADADANIKTATTLIDKARSDGRTTGLDATATLLSNAQAAYTSGNYTKASTLATQAITGAGSATQPLDAAMLAGVVIVVAIVAVAAVLLRRRGGKQEPKPTEVKLPEAKGVVDVDHINNMFTDLREEDREVIKLLASSGGQVYADLIRERLQMPKTSAWRLIKRLSGLGIVYEKNVGGRSLICIDPKYRKETD